MLMKEPSVTWKWKEWLDRQIMRYHKWHFGLWAVILKNKNKLIGQCGLIMQPWKDTEVLPK